MSHQINITRIKGVANALAELKDEIAFVGGATVSLYADIPEQTDARPTDDIDVLVEIASYKAYTQLQEKLNTLGFEIDVESKVICRYKYQGLTVDIMPTGEDVLGFKNRWYEGGFANLETYNVSNGTDINIFPVAYFIASKIEAYNDRGKGDGRMSQDFEDIVFVLDNRESIWTDLTLFDGEISEYLKDEFKKFLAEPHINEWISVHLEPATANERTKRIIQGLNAIIKDLNSVDKDNVI